MATITKRKKKIGFSYQVQLRTNGHYIININTYLALNHKQNGNELIDCNSCFVPFIIKL